MSALNTTSTQHLWFVWTCFHCFCKEVLQAPPHPHSRLKDVICVGTSFFGVRFVPIWLIRLTQQQKKASECRGGNKTKDFYQINTHTMRAVSILFVYHSPAFVNNMYLYIISCSALIYFKGPRVYISGTMCAECRFSPSDGSPWSRVRVALRRCIDGS